MSVPHIALDLEAETLTIFGVAYTLDLFRALAFGPIGGHFELIARDDGAVTLRLLPAPVLSAHGE